VTDDLAERVSALLLPHPAVRAVTLVGSRSQGRATELSDWDVLVDADLDALEPDLDALLAPLEPLAAQWDRLSEEASYYMLVLPGGVKVDLVFDRPPKLEPPWRVSAATLPGIDAHFWDWILWLGSKALRGESRFVADELEKMYRFLLAPVGVAVRPGSLDEAVASYVRARQHAMDSLRIGVRPELGRQVSDALRRHALLVT